MAQNLIPIGYMAKRVLLRPNWLKTTRVTDIYSVSPCLSPNFADFISYWQHNGWWFFDSPEKITALAENETLDLSGTTLFYYEALPQEYDLVEQVWFPIAPEPGFLTEIQIPAQKTLQGYDLVTFSCGTSPECSWLSCNQMAETIEVNSHCLLERLEDALAHLQGSFFQDCEPGPCRVFAVYTLPDLVWGGLR